MAKRKNNPIVLNKKGRWVVRLRGRKCWEDLWARVVYQNYVLNGEEISKGMVIHHINGDCGDDRIENLQMLTNSEHISLHHRGKFVSEDARKRMGDSHLGSTRSEETKKKMSESGKGKIFTEEHKRKISEGKSGVKLTEEHKQNISKAGKGRIVSEETREKISTIHTGKKFTEEHKKNISNSKIGNTYRKDYFARLKKEKERSEQVDQQETF